MSVIVDVLLLVLGCWLLIVDCCSNSLRLKTSLGFKVFETRNHQSWNQLCLLWPAPPSTVQVVWRKDVHPNKPLAHVDEELAPPLNHWSIQQKHGEWFGKNSYFLWNLTKKQTKSQTLHPATLLFFNEIKNHQKGKPSWKVGRSTSLHIDFRPLRLHLFGNQYVWSFVFKKESFAEKISDSHRDHKKKLEPPFPLPQTFWVENLLSMMFQQIFLAKKKEPKKILLTSKTKLDGKNVLANPIESRQNLTKF